MSISGTKVTKKPGLISLKFYGLTLYYRLRLKRIIKLRLKLRKLWLRMRRKPETFGRTRNIETRKRLKSSFNLVSP